MSESEEIYYLTAEDVITFHDDLLKEYGGLPGCHLSKLESKLALPMSEYFGQIQYKTIHEKAAVYHYHLAIGHCFVDGNKRTAYTSAFNFLLFNGYSLEVSDDDMIEWTLRLANHEDRPSFEDAVEWILDHMIEFDEIESDWNE